MDKDTQKLIGIGIAFGIALWLIKGGVVAGAKAVGTAVNPVNRDNIFARGVNAVGDVLDDGTDDDSFSLGSFLFDVFNPDAPNSTKNPDRVRSNIDGVIE